jgi:hypothetical protein
MGPGGLELREAKLIIKQLGILKPSKELIEILSLRTIETFGNKVVYYLPEDDDLKEIFNNVGLIEISKIYDATDNKNSKNRIKNDVFEEIRKVKAILRKTA